MTDDGKINKTIEDRKAKGFVLISSILAILHEIPLGKFKIEMGLHLRQAMLINGILYNSEAWHGLTEAQCFLSGNFLHISLSSEKTAVSWSLSPLSKN